MASRFTIDTNILRIRDVFALNASNAEFIQPMQIPIVGQKGQFKWYSSLEFLSSISIPTASTNVLDLLQCIQPGLSSLSTLVTTTINTVIPSTVTGLGSIGYVSTSYLQNQINELSYTYKYISATTLYDCIASLGNMQRIGNELGPMIMGSNLNGGYVSTVNPGQYRIYRSTFSLLGSNLPKIAIDNTTSYTSCEIPIRGFQTSIVSTSKMEIDIQTNMNINYWNGLGDLSFVSTTLINSATGLPVGQPTKMDIPVYQSNVYVGNVKYLLKPSDLTPYPSSLLLQHSLRSGLNEPCEITTLIPGTNGIFVTLDNLD
jgi:hypothetical protein